MSTYNKPYIWRSPKSFPQAAWLDHRRQDIKNEKKTHFLTFSLGRSLPFDSGHPNFAFTMQDPKDYDLVFHTDQLPVKWLKYDCLPNNLGSPVVNKKILALLKDFCPEDLQDFPVIIRNGNPKLPDFEVLDYSLLNLTHLVDAIDKEQSIISYYESGNVNNIKRFVLKEDCLANHHLGRIDIYKSEVLASPELVALFKKEKVKGVRFVEDWEAYPYIPPEVLLYHHFQDDKEAGKQYFVSLLNTNEDYELFKKGITNIPRKVVEELIEMTLSRSSFHAEQCAELRELLEKSDS